MFSCPQIWNAHTCTSIKSQRLGPSHNIVVPHGKKKNIKKKEECCRYWSETCLMLRPSNSNRHHYLLGLMMEIWKKKKLKKKKRKWYCFVSSDFLIIPLLSSCVRFSLGFSSGALQTSQPSLQDILMNKQKRNENNNKKNDTYFIYMCARSYCVKLAR